MNNQIRPITIREAMTTKDIERFWQQLHAYHIRDIFPEPDSEERAYFLDDSLYRAHMEKIHSREKDKCYYLFFVRDGQEIGFAMPVIYNSEDGKCFLMEFCVYPEFRGCGAGKRCADAFLRWAKDMGAAYTELNCDTTERIRFWNYSGFRLNGRDEWGVPLMLRRPEEDVPVNVERLTDTQDWQLLKLMNGFLASIGEECLTEEKREKLQYAIREGKITFFLARRGYRAVGMCSVSKCYSTFSCGEVAIFDDFFIEPVFRKQGIARMLTLAAKDWCAEQGISSLSVTCAPCDEVMYSHLGFRVSLGKTFAYFSEKDS